MKLSQADRDFESSALNEAYAEQLKRLFHVLVAGENTDGAQERFGMGVAMLRQAVVDAQRIMDAVDSEGAV